MEPSEFLMEIPYFSIAFAASDGGLARRVSILLKDVPDWLPLIPAFAINPIA